MKPARPHINNLSTAAQVKVGDMVSYEGFVNHLEVSHYDPPPVEHGLVVEVSAGSIVKVRPLNDWNGIRLLNVADVNVVKAKQ